MKLRTVFAILVLSVVVIRGSIWAFPEATNTRAQLEWLGQTIGLPTTT